MLYRLFSFALCWAILSLCAAAQSVGSLTVRPLHEGLLMVHYIDGYIDYHGNGEPWGADQVFVNPISIPSGNNVASYSLSSDDDANYSTARRPLDVGFKSKPREISAICDGWGTLAFYGKPGCLNPNPDRVMEHWFYLELPQPLVSGNTYTLDVVAGVTGTASTTTFTWDDQDTHSEALHVNNLGYTRVAPQTVGYLYHWGGDLGGIDFSAYQGQPFHLVDQADGNIVFSGTVAFRAGENNRETNQNDPNETPNQNFVGAPMWECDFSAFREVGEYKLSVPGVGASFPFVIGCDALRPAYQAAARSLYHVRSGIAKEEPYTEFTRPADHNPAVTPGFADRLIYTDFSICEADSPENSNQDSWEAGARGNLTTTFGWYHDAGDWDAYGTHAKVPPQLLLTYQLFSENFRDGDLNIPESGNGIPDLFDEAMWLPRFYQRLRAEIQDKGWGTGGVAGARVFGDFWGEDNGPGGIGRGSWQDTDRDWYVSGEDPVHTYAYAGMAAHIASLLADLGVDDPEGVDWQAEALSAYAWAEARYNPNFGCHSFDIREKKNYAAAALLRLTGESTYDDDFRSSWSEMGSNTFEEDAIYGACLYLSLPESETDANTRQSITSKLQSVADFYLTGFVTTRGARYGGNPWLPMLIGQSSTPILFEGLMGYALLKDGDPTRGEAYYRTLHNTADYFLGTNPLNMTWMTGVGDRHQEHLFNLDFWHDDHEGFAPGFTSYGPWRRMPNTPNAGWWDIGWAEQSVYPEIDQWPGHERWFGMQPTPISAEFTVHQNLVHTATLYGALSGPASCVETTTATRERDRPITLDLTISPNPTEGEIYLRGEDFNSLEILQLYDMNGRLLRQFAPNPTLQLGDFQAGAYVLRVVTPKGSQAMKIVLR